MEKVLNQLIALVKYQDSAGSIAISFGAKSSMVFSLAKNGVSGIRISGNILIKNLTALWRDLELNPVAGEDQDVLELFAAFPALKTPEGVAQRTLVLKCLGEKIGAKAVESAEWKPNELGTHDESGCFGVSVLLWSLIEHQDPEYGVALEDWGDVVTSPLGMEEAMELGLPDRYGRILAMFPAPQQPGQAVTLFGLDRKDLQRILPVFWTLNWVRVNGHQGGKSFVKTMEMACFQKNRKHQEEYLISTFFATASTGNAYALLGIPAGSDPKTAKHAFDHLSLKFEKRNLGPEIRDKFQKEIQYIRMKLSEAFALIAVGQLEEGRKKHEVEVDLESSMSRREMSKTKLQISQEQHDHQVAAYVKRAENCLEEDNKYDAERYFRLALGMDSDSPKILHSLGKLLSKHKHPKRRKEAENFLATAWDLNPYEVDYALDLTRFYLHHGLRERANSSLEMAQKLAPQNPDVAELRKQLK